MPKSLHPLLHSLGDRNLGAKCEQGMLVSQPLHQSMKQGSTARLESKHCSVLLMR